jgi:hypothetical protein
VGESSRQETAITVTGLKPGHFYNVRVIAVGNNNFQAGSRVIRLRTYGRDGRPELSNGRIPTNLSTEELQNGTTVDSSDESAGVRSHRAGIEAATAPEGTQAIIREQGTSHLGSRRNTGGRRHSPSTASEHPMPNPTAKTEADESMQQLTERFEAIRAETEEVVAQVSKDAEEFKQQMVELIKERDEKKQALKEKEEASEKLRKEVHYSERSNRQAQNRKSQKEKSLREKQAEKIRMQDDIARWEREIREMRNEKESWEREKENIAQSRQKKVEELRNTLRKRQISLNSMEEEIRLKGLQIKELEEERQKLPGAEDDEDSKERDAQERQRDIQWELKERDIMARCHTQAIIFRNLESDLQKAQAFYAQLSARQANNPVMYQGNSSAVDFDNGQGRAKPRRSRQRKSRTNTISSPIAAYPITDSAFPNASTYNNMSSVAAPNFAQGPYFDMSADTGLSQLSESTGMSEADIRSLTAGAPLSPTATSLLPSNIFADDEPPSPRFASARPFGPSFFPSLGAPNYDNDQQSPGSSSRSASLMSSPQTSSHNLPMFSTIRDPGIESDRRSLHSPGAEFGIIGSPSISNAQPAPSRRFGDIFSFPRQRGKTVNDEGPALGSLKLGQSHSFPRQTDEADSLGIRNRRTSFSTGWSGLPFLSRSGAGGEVSEGNGPAPARNIARRRRGFNMFSSNVDNQVYSERDPSSPRPASIASSEFPRPSTDSAPFGWPAADGGVATRNSPLATNWSLNVTQHPWSRNPSRRASIQHGSTSALSTSIATEDDDFLPESSPPPVGVIGTRPQSSKSTTPKLNPNAPTFKAMFIRSSKSEKSDKAKGKSKSKDNPEPAVEPPTFDDMSPTESRKSRDTRSIHTQTDSITESHESLDRTMSNTTSDMLTTTPAAKDGKETSLQKLLRKGSSSKFSISSFRGKDSSLFGSKKGGSANSDRNASGDRSSSFGDVEEGADDHTLGRNVDSVTSSPQIGGAGTPKEGRMGVNWGRFSIKKGKGGTRTSMDAAEREKERASEAEGTEDDEK